MANFKVGDRVRKIAAAPRKEPWRHDELTSAPIGTVGTVRRLPGWLPWFPEVYGIEYDDIKATAQEWHGAYAWMLAPLTDPRATQFIEDMERFARVVNVPLVQIP